MTSLLWAFSFGLLAGPLDGAEPTFVAAVRLGLAALVLAPFLWGARVQRSHALKLAVVGAVQFGLMYELYIRSYGELGQGQGHLVALFTALIPLHVVLVESAWSRRIEPRALGGAILALAGAGVLSWQLPRGTGIWRAFLLVQAANLCFATGQVAYRRLHATVPLDHKSAHALAFLGAVAVAFPACLVWGSLSRRHVTWMGRHSPAWPTWAWWPRGSASCSGTGVLHARGWGRWRSSTMSKLRSRCSWD